MLNRFQDKTQKIIALSENIAFDLGQSNVGSEHLLLAILKSKDAKAKQLLEKENITYETIKNEIIELFGTKQIKPFYMEYTQSFKKILENALIVSKKKSEDKVSVEALLVALLEKEGCVALDI